MSTISNVDNERISDEARAVETEALKQSAFQRKLGERLSYARRRAADAKVIVVERGMKSARAADTYVHDRPWTTAAAALGVGMLIGLLIGRK
ncbi:hypothetical protein WT26_30105 [Burkholderia cepacia]|uniref:DUF883 domain-containing protein n=2 Tax=Burkholderia cepacia complex TaxID=87882 RepID=A0A1B4Q1J8_BURCE|nr:MULTISPECIES: DUF883 family protein [Burkholderia cepacia complex]AOK20059.1 hypothetical protein WT26_30105 [Burkholderia cepacia]AOK26832.1 hypothetical protein WK67_29970 [Burkholderia ubonensis]